MTLSDTHEFGQDVVTPEELHGNALNVPVETGLPPDDPMSIELAQKGVIGRPILSFETGDQKFAVLDISTSHQIHEYRGNATYEPYLAGARVTRDTPEVFEVDEKAPYILLHLDQTGTLTGRAIRPGYPIFLGRRAHERDPKSGRFQYKGDTFLSSDHASVKLSEDLQSIEVQDRNSTNGTIVFSSRAITRPERAQSQRENEDEVSTVIGRITAGRDLEPEDLPPTERTKPVSTPEYANALDLNPDELWRLPNNGGRAQDQSYIETYRQARQHLVGAFKDGTLYASARQFMSTLKQEHKFIYTSGHYERLNGHGLDKKEIGEFRDKSWGRPENIRLSNSLHLLPDAERLGDQYATSRRFAGGPATTEQTSVVNLPGIDRKNLPYDVVRYDDQGKMKRLHTSDYDKSGYQFFYPPTEAVEQYMTQYQLYGVAISQAINEGVQPKEDTLDLIARQYQYGACARPFAQINNSLFMELANMQVKLLGYKGITHGDLDIAAQRLQPDTFAVYFAEHVKRANQ